MVARLNAALLSQEEANTAAVALKAAANAAKAAAIAAQAAVTESEAVVAAVIKDAGIQLEDTECSICCDKKVDCTLNCGHLFCFDCAQRLIDCPTCRAPIQVRIKIYL